MVITLYVNYCSVNLTLCKSIQLITQFMAYVQKFGLIFLNTYLQYFSHIFITKVFDPVASYAVEKVRCFRQFLAIRVG